MAESAKDFLARMAAGHKPKGDICAGPCGQTLSTAVTGRQWTKSGDMCDDCYFDALGELVEQSPIRTPRLRKG